MYRTGQWPDKPIELRCCEIGPTPHDSHQLSLHIPPIYYTRACNQPPRQQTISATWHCVYTTTILNSHPTVRFRRWCLWLAYLLITSPVLMEFFDSQLYFVLFLGNNSWCPFPFFQQFWCFSHNFCVYFNMCIGWNGFMLSKIFSFC